MLTYAVIVMIVGFFLWLIFTKWTKVADSWVARLGEIMFAVGLFWVLSANAVKSVL